jgi:hypothetical protein
MSIEDTLTAREARYGDFSDNASYAQGIKEIMRGSRSWGRLASSQREALELIASKIGRLLSGDPAYADNWHDIGGYAKLVEDRLDATQRSRSSSSVPPKAPRSEQGTLPSVQPQVVPQEPRKGPRVSLSMADSES